MNTEPYPEVGDVWISRHKARWFVEMTSGPNIYMRNETTKIGRWFSTENVWLYWTKESMQP